MPRRKTKKKNQTQTAPLTHEQCMAKLSAYLMDTKVSPLKKTVSKNANTTAQEKDINFCVCSEFGAKIIYIR